MTTLPRYYRGILLGTDETLNLYVQGYGLFCEVVNLDMRYAPKVFASLKPDDLFGWLSAISFHCLCFQYRVYRGCIRLTYYVTASAVYSLFSLFGPVLTYRFVDVHTVVFESRQLPLF